MSDQLDFSYPLPSQVLVFPVRANVAKVRRCASMLIRKKGKAADHYWQRTVEPIAQRLAKAGVPHSIIQAEIKTFSDAVHREMQRLVTKGKSA